jgi:hypothetical protein
MCYKETYSLPYTPIFIQTSHILIASWNVVTKRESLVISSKLLGGEYEINCIHTARQALRRDVAQLCIYPCIK